MEITLCIRGQKLEAHYPTLYSGSIGVLYARFAEVDFDKTLIKTVRFKTADSDWYTADITDGAALVPHEVIVDGGFDIALAGYDSEDGELTRFLPTNSVHIDVTENGFGDPDAPLKTEGDFESVIAKLDKMAVKGALSSEDNVFDDLPAGVYHLNAGVTNAPVDWGGTLIVSRSEFDERNMVYSDRIFITGDAEYNAEKEGVGFIYQATLYGTAGSELGVDTPWYDVTRKSEIDAEIKTKADLSLVEKLIPKTTIKGETLEITDHLEGMEAINYRIYGNSTQETRSGKNKARPNAVSSGANGIIATTDADGVVTFSGTATSEADTVITVAGLKTVTEYWYSYTRQSDVTAMKLSVYSADTLERVSLPVTTGVHWTGVDSGKSYYGVNPTTEEALYFRRIYVQFTPVEGENILAGSYVFQLEEGSTATDYEPYGVSPSPEYPSEIESVGDLVTDEADEHYGKYSVPVVVSNETRHIYLDEPLRKVGDYADYIDYQNQQMVRMIEVSDDSGTLSIEESLKALAKPVYESIELPPVILPESDTVHISTSTEVAGNIELTYYQDINKKLAELQSMIVTA